MADAWRNQNLPGAESSGIDRVDQAKRSRMTPQVVEKNLNHPGHRGPQIRLLRMVVDCLDCIGVSERKGNLNLSCAVRDHIGGEPSAKPRNFGEKTAVIGIDLERLASEPVEETNRIRPCEYFCPGLLVFA